MKNEKIFIMMIGLPCTGKSYISKALVKFFSEKEILIKEFNIG